MPLSLTANRNYHDVSRPQDFHRHNTYGLIMQRTGPTRASAGVQNNHWYAMEYVVNASRFYFREVHCVNNHWEYVSPRWDVVYVNVFHRSQWWIPNEQTLEMIARQQSPQRPTTTSIPNNDLEELRRLIMRAEQRHVQAQASVTNPRVRTWPPITSRTRYRGITEEII